MQVTKVGKVVELVINGEELPTSVAARHRMGIKRTRVDGGIMTEPLWRRARVTRENERYFTFTPDRAGIWEIIIQGRRNHLVTKIMAIDIEMVETPFCPYAGLGADNG